MAAGNQQKSNLGRGLSTLLGELGAENLGSSKRALEQMVPIEFIRPNPLQPRTEFDEDQLAELTESVSEKGILQPLILRPDPENPKGYMIVAGERRWRAAQRVQLHEIPAVIKELTDSECLEVGLIENIQRSDLNPMEEALAYRQLMQKFGHTQERLSAVVGKSRSFIANRLRLLNLPDKVKKHVRSGKLSAGHARALVSATEPSAIADQIVNLDLSVRQAEVLAKKSQDKTSKSGIPVQRRRKDANTRLLEASMSAALDAKVAINLSAQSGSSGRLVVEFKDLDQLQEIYNLIRRAGANRGKL